MAGPRTGRAACMKAASLPAVRRSEVATMRLRAAEPRSRRDFRPSGELACRRLPVRAGAGNDTRFASRAASAWSRLWMPARRYRSERPRAPNRRDVASCSLQPISSFQPSTLRCARISILDPLTVSRELASVPSLMTLHLSPYGARRAELIIGRGRRGTVAGASSSSDDAVGPHHRRWRGGGRNPKIGRAPSATRRFARASSSRANRESRHGHPISLRHAATSAARRNQNLGEGATHHAASR